MIQSHKNQKEQYDLFITYLFFSYATDIIFFTLLLTSHIGGFGGLEEACWPSVPKFAGLNPAEAVGFLRRKNPQHAFLQRGSKAVGNMS
jgi:hypothetical protein